MGQRYVSISIGNLISYLKKTLLSSDTVTCNFVECIHQTTKTNTFFSEPLPQKSQFSITLSFLINGETLINGEDGKFMLSGRVENFFYYIKIHVEGGKFLKIK